jgi:DNA-binding transcriptional regulator LsrR (DeoR family)
LDSNRAHHRERKLDQAARAAWLYYVAGNTQDEIAAKLGVSRQVAQRLVSLAVAEKLIKFRLDHPIAEAMALAEDLRQRFGLARCLVEPVDPARDNPIPSIALAAAGMLTAYLSQDQPLVLALSTGRTLRAAVDEVPRLACPQHKIVSLVGAISREGRASPFEVVMRLAERTGAQCYPMPTPVITDSVAERELLQTQRFYGVIRELAETAVAAFVGLSQIGWGSPLHHDRFITDQELHDLVDRGAVGEIAGWAYDSGGRILEKGTNERVTGLPLARLGRATIIAVAGGPEKVTAIRSALRGELLGELITDEATARAILSGL